MFKLILRKCGALGLIGITVDEQYGGAGLDAVFAEPLRSLLQTS